MSLLKPEKTSAKLSIAERRAQIIKQQIAKMWQDLVRAHQQGVATIWDLPEGTSVKEIAEHLGEDAAQIFRIHSKLADFINEEDPNNARAIPDDFNIEFKDDGTVIIS